MKTQLLILLFLFCSMARAQEQYPVYFDVDKAAPNDESLAKFRAWMENNKDLEIIKVNAYADSTAGADYNLKLSQRRAASVLRLLKDNNFTLPENVTVKGWGETTVFSDNKSSNRIVMIHYSRPKPMAMPNPVTETLVAAVKPEEASDIRTAIQTAKKGDKIVMKGLRFYIDMATVLPESKPMLRELLKAMQDNPKLKIDIQGHMCCSKDRTNLSGDRAKSVYGILVKNGIDKNRITYRGFGSEKPVYPLPEKNEEQMAANRRVEIEIVEK